MPFWVNTRDDRRRSFRRDATLRADYANMNDITRGATLLSIELAPTLEEEDEPVTWLRQLRRPSALSSVYLVHANVTTTVALPIASCITLLAF